MRANHCDMELLTKNYLSKFSLPAGQLEPIRKWYEELNDMMHHEGVLESGHLQINRNTLQALTELHVRLLASPKFPYYSAAYYKILPYVVEVRSKGGEKEISELETCFNMLYGVMMLRLQKKEIGADTQKAMKDVTTMLGMLSDYYLKDKKEPLEL